MEKTKKIPLNIALLATLIAVGLHIYLTQKYFGLKFGSISSISACNINQIFNCDAVSASQYSSFLGLPLALWGAVTNFFFLLMLLITRFEATDYPEQTARYTAWYAIFIALASLVMGFISLTMVKSVCLFCIICYVLSFIALYGALKGQSQLISHFKADLGHLLQNQKWVLFTLFAIPAFAFFINAAILQASGFDKLDLIAQEKIQQWKSSPAQNFDSQTGLIFQNGEQNPTMTIVEFADFRCSHCKHAYPTLHAYTQAHPEVKLVFKYFPLDGTCNPDPGMKGGGNGISCHMAYLSHCAEKVAKKGWDAHHYLFDHQEELRDVSDINKISELVCSGIAADCAQIKSCLSESTTIEAIRSTSMEGVAAQITGTPAIFVNGKLLIGGQLMPILDEARKQILGQ